MVKQLSFLLRRIARGRSGELVDVHLWGHRLRLRPRGNISEGTFLFMPRIWDREERKFLARSLEEGDVFVDVGANAGGYVWWVVPLVGAVGRIVAVEPDPDLRARLLFNLRENQIENVQVHAVAVGAEEGEGRLRRDPKNRGENVLLTAAGGEGEDDEPGDVLTVPVRTLPELLVGAGVDRVDALKIDVEGREPEILGDFLDRAPERLWPRVFLTEYQATPEHRALHDRLGALGYRERIRTRLNLGFERLDGTRTGGGATSTAVGRGGGEAPPAR